MPVGRILMLADEVKRRQVQALTVRARSDTLMVVVILGRVYVVGKLDVDSNVIRPYVCLRRDKTFNWCSFLILGRGSSVCW
jgi:hypothetical protein